MAQLRYGGGRTSCERHKRYQTFEDAKTAAKNLRKHKGPRVKPYLCNYGGQNHWHVGHDRRKRFLTGKYRKAEGSTI